MEGMKHCQYAIDGLQCEYPFAHSGDHLVTVTGRETRWVYPEDLRDADLARGYPPCYEGYEHNGTLYVCREPMGHEGMHESHDGLTFSDEDIERSLNQEQPAEPEHTTPTPAPTVAAAIKNRENEDESFVGVRLTSGHVEHHAIIMWQVVEGALYLRTRTEDIVYAKDQWAGVKAEPRS